MPTDLSSPTLLEMLERDTSYMAEIKAIETGAPVWLSVKQTAAYLDRSVRQIRRYQADGKMPERKKCGRERRYPRSELEKIKSSLD
jgi:hypothetical protein